VSGVWEFWELWEFWEFREFWEFWGEVWISIPQNTGLGDDGEEAPR